MVSWKNHGQSLENFHLMISQRKTLLSKKTRYFNVFSGRYVCMSFLYSWAEGYSCFTPHTHTHTYIHPPAKENLVYNLSIRLICYLFIQAEFIDFYCPKKKQKQLQKKPILSFHTKEWYKYHKLWIGKMRLDYESDRQTEFFGIVSCLCFFFFWRLT